MMLTHQFSKLVLANRELWVKLGDLETNVLRGRLENIEIRKPVYVCGLARCGTTILLEMLSRSRRVATHTYRDFPLLFTPFAWNKLLVLDAFSKDEYVERAHKDGLMVNQRSPESMEEVLWMSFFDSLHDSQSNNTLDRNTRNRRFEKFYTEHVKKLLLVKEKARYLAKANYNISRIEYLLTLFPDAMFVVAVRDPVDFVASSRKQDHLFRSEHQKDARTLEHTDMMGHFEFGLHRRLINVGRLEESEKINRFFASGDEISGWAAYWAYVYGFVRDSLESDGGQRNSIRVVRYEDLCLRASDVVCDLYAYCELEAEPEIGFQAADDIRMPSYPRNLSEHDIVKIRRQTEEVAAYFGYEIE